jgi:Prefoldin subunit
MSAEPESLPVNPAVRYRELVSECNQLMNKVADLESDLVEHALVEDTLKPLDGGRRAYRLVGDVLVERTVAEVLPSITKNKENVCDYALFLLVGFFHGCTSCNNFFFL